MRGLTVSLRWNALPQRLLMLQRPSTDSVSQPVATMLRQQQALLQLLCWRKGLAKVMGTC